MGRQNKRLTLKIPFNSSYSQALISYGNKTCGTLAEVCVASVCSWRVVDKGKNMVKWIRVQVLALLFTG